MKSLIFYNTRSGNTKGLAEKLKEILEKKGYDCVIYRDKEIKKDLKKLEDYELLLIGSCTHIGGPAFFPFRCILKKIRKMDSLKDKYLICFATSKDPKDWKKTCGYIKKKLAHLKYIGEVGCVEKEYQNALEEFEKVISNIK
ncbi:MAG: flavodoxin family protein [Candidatus Helarchaeota archaeon]